ncbi:ABC transporter permease [Dermatobacter hominis]|uniref:ABC transporter permease n=1 Tax=Dermatobacter hominis TaxID=2884263 RepID=UPI001D0FFAD8|nr:ABC transporter permease [Dermatobacter hominis]UDY35135.1 ABC transporter permease [Dermatobacter hominis]
MNGLWVFFTSSESWRGDNGIWARLLAHVWVCVLALAAAGVLAIPGGLALGRRRRGQVVASAVANIGRAIPSLAVLAFVVAAGGGIGFLPTFVAMFALAVPPMFVSTATAIAELDRDVIDAGRGLGMTPLGLLRRVELPLASPLILSGVRIATGQVIATATLGAFVGYNTLGRFITLGRANRDDGMLYGGVVLVVGLALIADVGIRAVARAATPWEARGRTAKGPSAPAAGAELQ